MSQFLATGCYEADTLENKVRSVEKVTLTVLAGLSTTDAGIEDMIDELVEEYYPEIDLEWEIVGWGERFAPQLVAKFASGEVPDIMIGKAQDVSTYVSTGNLAPLEGAYLDNILEMSLPGVTFDGKVYGLPFNALYQGVLYNKELFRNFSIEVPKTKEDLDNIVEKFNKAQITPFASHFQEIWYVGNITMQFAMNEVFANTPNWGDQFRNQTVSFSTSDEFSKCFAYNQWILDNSWEDALMINYIDCDERFANGSAAMYVSGSWSLQNIIANNPNMEVGIFPFPNDEGNSNLIFEPNMTFMKSSKSEHGEEIDKVLELLFNNEEFAIEVFNFTKTASMLKDIGPTYPELIQTEIDDYVNEGRITDATVGNTQLIWSFQEEYSRQIYSWLQGHGSMENALKYADDLRESSATSSKNY